MMKIMKAAFVAVALVAQVASAAGPSGIVEKLFVQSGAGAVPRPAHTKMRESVSVEDFGADKTGTVDSSAAFAKALAAAGEVRGVPGSVYLISNVVTVGNDKKLIGNGATIKGTSGVTTFHLTGNDVLFKGWKVAANYALYFIRNDGQRNTFAENRFSGDVGHYIFSPGSLYTKVVNNAFECESDNDVTTAVVMEASQNFLISGNTFNGVPVGWSIQMRASSHSGTVTGNTFRQFRWTHGLTATAGQTVFNYTLGSKVNFKGIQINGKPLSRGYTWSQGACVPGACQYTATFAVGRTAGESVTMIGYRGAENIQVNTSAYDLTISNNVINGTGDSGIVVLGDRISITGNIVKNAGYACIALYGGQNNITVSGNTLSDCSQLDDGLSSPDNPELPSVFNGAVLLSGAQLSVTGNTIINDAGTMAYGVRVNTVENIEDGTGDKAIKIGGNNYRGSFAYGKVFMPNDSSGQRVQSVDLMDGVTTSYPERVNLDGAWTNAPVSTPYFGYSGFGTTYATRDTVEKLGGVASLKTFNGEYVDIALLASGMLKNTVVKLSFWAKNNSGSSYVSLFSTLAGLNAPVTVNITDTAWKQYSITVPFTDNLTAFPLIRIGSNSGTANVQHIEITAVRL